MTREELIELLKNRGFYERHKEDVAREGGVIYEGFISIFEINFVLYDCPVVLFNVDIDRHLNLWEKPTYLPINPHIISYEKLTEQKLDEILKQLIKVNKALCKMEKITKGLKQ